MTEISCHDIVFHCHILPHEDTGMMQNFLILPPDDEMNH